MYKLFTDKVELFECDVKLEGASLTNSIARIVIESQDVNLLFNGTISADGKCKIPIKRLKGLLGENTKGTLKLEIIAEDTYFVPWSSDFSVQAAKKVTVEIKSQAAAQILENAAPAVKVTSVKGQVKENKQPLKNKRVPLSVQEHIMRIVKILVRENISLSNLKIKKDRLNNIMAVYTRKCAVNENQTSQIIEGILKNLPK
jgi:hypothetical protein